MDEYSNEPLGGGPTRQSNPGAGCACCTASPSSPLYQRKLHRSRTPFWRFSSEEKESKPPCWDYQKQIDPHMCRSRFAVSIEMEKASLETGFYPTGFGPKISTANRGRLRQTANHAHREPSCLEESLDQKLPRPCHLRPRASKHKAPTGRGRRVMRARSSESAARGFRAWGATACRSPRCARRRQRRATCQKMCHCGGIFLGCPWFLSFLVINLKGN